MGGGQSSRAPLAHQRGPARPRSDGLMTAATAKNASERYVVISSDCHDGADLHAYRPYLEPAYRDDFDSWAETYVNPFADLVSADAERNWNSDRRLRDLEADG